MLNSSSDGKRKKIDDQPQFSISTSNRFTVLGEETTGENSEESTQNSCKIPPIYVHNTESYSSLLNDIKSTANEDFYTKNFKNEIKIQFTSINDFRDFRKLCETKQIQFHSFRDPTKRMYAVIMKGVPVSYSEKYIFDELSRLGYPILSVYRLYDKSKNPIETCALDLKNSLEARDILKLIRFEYCVVKVLPRPKSNSPIQCKKCQRIGHSQANCFLTARCVRCDGNHHWSQCTRDKSLKPIALTAAVIIPLITEGAQILKNFAIVGKVPKTQYQHLQISLPTRPLHPYQPQPCEVISTSHLFLDNLQHGIENQIYNNFNQI